MKRGADDYITKPFSATYLEARILNLIEQRKKLQAIYRAGLQPQENAQTDSKQATSELSPQDKKFMNSLMQTIEQNMDNGELSIDNLATTASMSRSVFFKKLKALTGLAPVEFLKEMRMKRAAQLLVMEENYTIADIAYRVGINDSHYFSKCFKQQFGITPTEYREKQCI
jgi:AraC-like DNA-binding protein